MSNSFQQNESISSSRKKIIVLGSGPNRIGQGIEFDYCCVHGLLAIKECGYEAIMINCNPETVSTDFDMAQVNIDADRAFIKAYNNFTALVAMTPAQVSTWVDNNVTNLAQAQDAIKTLALS